MVTRSVLRVRGAFFFEALLQPSSNPEERAQKSRFSQTGLVNV
jgi:hypothetical protein